LGTEQDIIQIFAENGDVGLVRGLASITGQEGEQEGFYRFLQGKIPNELPFLTTSTREFLFSSLHKVIVSEYCPSLSTISLPTFAALDLISSPVGETTNITFMYDISNTCMDNQSLSAVYINQQNSPIVEPVLVDTTNGSMMTAEAIFPYDEYGLNGLTILALTNTTGPFMNASEVANATVFGPAFIVI
jgi:hypothetical protein